MATTPSKIPSNNGQYLDKTGLRYLWNKIKVLIPTKTSQLTNDSGYINEVDSQLSAISTNPVQNKVIAAVVGTKPIPDQISEAIDEAGILTIDISGATSGITATKNADTLGGYDLSKFVMYGIPTTSTPTTDEPSKQSIETDVVAQPVEPVEYATVEQLNTALKRIAVLEEKLTKEE